MKTTLHAAVAAALSFAAASAYAAPGDSDPFPYRAPGITVVSPQAYAVDTGANAYPDLSGRPSQVVTLSGADAVPMTGSQAGVNTANSLPRGFTEGTAAYAQERSMQRYRAAQQATRPSGVPQGSKMLVIAGTSLRSSRP